MAKHSEKSDMLTTERSESADVNTAQKPPESTEKPAKGRGDPWEEPCPLCGLLGCRRHA